jgi:hypothetical protein
MEASKGKRRRGEALKKLPLIRLALNVKRRLLSPLLRSRRRDDEEERAEKNDQLSVNAIVSEAQNSEFRQFECKTRRSRVERVKIVSNYPAETIVFEPAARAGDTKQPPIDFSFASIVGWPGWREGERVSERGEVQKK